MNNLRFLAGTFIGFGALLFIWRGEYTTAAALLGSMVGFFTGEANGKRATAQNQSA